MCVWEANSEGKRCVRKDGFDNVYCEKGVMGMAGITGYGAYVPRFRLKVDDIWDVWVNQIDTPAVIKERRGLAEKAVQSIIRVRWSVSIPVSHMTWRTCH